MFDLEENIRSWRRALLERAEIASQHADELEDHLREEIEGLHAAALSEEEVFLIATRRLGRVEVLADEFAKATATPRWRMQLQWMLCGYVLVSLTLGAISAAAIYAFSIARRTSIGMAVYAAVLLLGVIGVVFLARWASRASSADRLRAVFARCVQTRGGILGLALLAIVTEILVSGARVTWVQNSQHVAWMGFILYAQWFLWLIPMGALATLAWRDRARLRDVEGSRIGRE